MLAIYRHPASPLSGTGEHTTTQLCLRHLSSLDLAGAAVLDYGTGTGVLGIGALQMGARVAVSGSQVYLMQ